MTGNIWKDGEVFFQGVEVSLFAPRDDSSDRQWEGSLRVAAEHRIDFRGRYSLEFDDGKSADILLTYVLGRNPRFVHFHVLAWKEKLLAGDTAGNSLPPSAGNV
jgi:hypothetical protein